MMDLLQTILSFIVAIGILVTVHEFGHFWVARKLGVKILRFSVGFGKPLLRRVDRHGTEFVIAAIPLGGYVRMLGEDDDELTDDNRHLAFNLKPVKSRIAIVLAGPLFNFLFAVAAYWLMYSVGVPGLKPVIGDIVSPSIAARAGMQADEHIISVNGIATPTWAVANTTLLDAALGSDTLSIRTLALNGNAGREYRLELGDGSSLLDEKGIIHNLGILPWRAPVWIGDITTGSAADLAGLQKGDRVIRADGIAIENWEQWVDYISARADTPIQLELERAGTALMLEVTPKPFIRDDGKSIGRIGVNSFVPDEVRRQHLAVVRYSPLAALGKAASETTALSILMLRMLGRMVIGDVSHKNISGPITIAQYAGASAGHSWLEFVRFLALISISLGVLNLLPIPMLDGGHLLYYVIESVRGGPLSEQAQTFGQQVGIILLVLLMGLAFYNDFARLAG